MKDDVWSICENNIEKVLDVCKLNEQMLAWKGCYHGFSPCPMFLLVLHCDLQNSLIYFGLFLHGALLSNSAVKNTTSSSKMLLKEGIKRGVSKIMCLVQNFSLINFLLINWPKTVLRR